MRRKQVFQNQILLVLSLICIDTSKCSIHRQKRKDFGSIDLDTVKTVVVDPSTISNQFTGALVFPFLAQPLANLFAGKKQYF